MSDAVQIVKAESVHTEPLTAMLAEFRAILWGFRDSSFKPNQEALRAEMCEYMLRSDVYTVYTALTGEIPVGYMVCRVQDRLVWVEQLYVRESHRRSGVAGMLFDRAETLSSGFGEDTVFNYVHPNNQEMIAFLRSRGYTVLNLIEIRKPYRNERLSGTIKVDDITFDY